MKTIFLRKNPVVFKTSCLLISGRRNFSFNTNVWLNWCGETNDIFPGFLSQDLQPNVDLWMSVVLFQTWNFTHNASFSNAYDGVRRVSGLRRKPAVSVVDPTHTYPHIPQKNRTPALSLQTPRANPLVAFLCTEHPHITRNDRVRVCNERVGVLLLSGMFGSVWSPSRRLQIAYVIPRPGVIRHILLL